MHISRRKFIKQIGTIIAPLALSATNILNRSTSDVPLKIHIFSKHLQFLNIKEASQMAVKLGFDGVDLTVRPKGHVLPENVETDLPQAIRAIKEAGSVCEMITTAISDVDNLYDGKTIKVAAENGVQFYRSNWFKYHKDKSMQESILIYQEKIKELGALNKQHGIIGCYQNHAGTKIGASYWEIKQLLEMVDTDYFGTQYDIRHAMVEGGLSWGNGLELLSKHIKTIVLKDYKWKKVDGKWKIENE